MKILINAIFVLAIASGIARADMEPTEQDYQSLDQMRVKLMRMQREMNKFMRDLAAPYADMDKTGMSAFAQDVRVDVTETDKNVIVRADLPGMSKDRINITLEKNRLLKIAGTREVLKEEKGAGIVRQERMSGSFERVLELPAECDSKNISATYKEGVLEIVLPKKKDAKTDTIKVNVQ